jgi:GH35 family endo-1,4-beta-xylanase
MKIKNVVTVLLIAIILASCAPAVTHMPLTETAIPPTSTFTPIPPTPTITPTPAPENLADAKDLPKWIDNYIHAFGGKVTINGVDMDAKQLTEEIRKSAEVFTQVKEINGVEYLFLWINGVPLAMREGKGQWEDLTSRKIIELGTKPDEVFRYIGVRYSDPFNVITSSKVDQVFAEEFNFCFLMDTAYHQIEKREGILTFQNAIDAAKSAKENGMITIGGPLVYGKSDFDYTYLKEKRSTLTRDELINIMKRHIKTQMEGTAGSVDIMLVVNEFQPRNVLDETWENPEKLSYDAYADIIGDDYVDIAFEYAREIDTKGGTVPPTTILIYNHTANHLPPGNSYWEGDNTTMTVANVNRLKDKGLIDGVGIQLHIEASKPPNIDNMIKTFRNYGIPVYVTEFDIDTSRLGGTDSQKEQIRTDLYRKILEGILKSNVTVALNHWSAVQEQGGGEAQLFDNQLNPTSNLYIERQVLYEYFLGN